MLKDDFRYYLTHRDELLKKYEGKFLAIKDQQVIGVYMDETEAINKTALDHELGTFLVQECSADPNSTKQTYYSRAIFV